MKRARLVDISKISLQKFSFNNSVNIKVYWQIALIGCNLFKHIIRGKYKKFRKSELVFSLVITWIYLQILVFHIQEQLKKCIRKLWSSLVAAQKIYLLDIKYMFFYSCIEKDSF